MSVRSLACVIVTVFYLTFALLAFAGLKLGLWIILQGWHTSGMVLLAIIGWLLIEGSILYSNILLKGSTQ